MKGPMHSRLACTLLLAGGVFLGACQRTGPTGEQPHIATATSYLEAAAQDVLGHQTRVLRLAEPGTCPGHFDIRPSEVRRLRACRVLLRFDFQRSLDARLGAAGSRGPRVCEVIAPGGMGRPETYFAVCRQVAEQFASWDLLTREDAARRLDAIRTRLAALSGDLTNRMAASGFLAAPVVASHRQRDFCEWLGLRVAAAFRPADVAGVREIDEAVTAGRLAQVKLVIANLPEGCRTADALAARLKARMVVFENFPAARSNRVAFDDMVTGNVNRLLAEQAP